MIGYRRVYYEYLGACYARSIGFLDVGGCANGVFGVCGGHGKSPCFSGLGFLRVFGVDVGVLNSFMVDGVEKLG